MDVFCLPSYREGCPNVALEAAAMELPIVAFRVSGVVDAVADGVTGRLVDAFDVEGLTTALQAYLEDDRLRTQHGQAGRRHVGALFSRALVWQTLLIFYSSLVSQRGTLPGRATRHLLRPES
jgi:glycosyltransferase involved in cell wall biosynthesis